MTDGEYKVGIDFNPSNSGAVNQIKTIAAQAINAVLELTKDSSNPEVKRLAALAVTHFEDGAMWGVKAVTKPDRQPS